MNRRGLAALPRCRWTRFCGRCSVRGAANASSKAKWPFSGIGGNWGERTRRPPAQILGHIGRGASHRRGEESRLGPSQRQAFSGFVIRQRPRAGSGAVIATLA